MKRLYYLADDLETTKSITDALHREGISDWNFHVLAKDEEGLYQHQIHSALPYHERDIIHTGERFGLIGALVGLAAGSICWGLELLPWDMNLFTLALITLVGLFFGAWQGGLVGLSREHYRIAPFHEDIEAGRYLLMVDVAKNNQSRVRELMNMSFPEVQRCGSSGIIDNPFERPREQHAPIR